MLREEKQPGLCTMRRHRDTSLWAKFNDCHRAWGGCGDSTWPKDNWCCPLSGGCSVENLHGGAEEQICVLPLPAQGTEEGTRQKVTFKCRIQLNSSVKQFHWLGYCLALLEDFGEYLQEKKPFYCFTNGEKLLLSKSFIVSSSKTPHKSCEGWRWEQENDKHK